MLLPLRSLVSVPDQPGWKGGVWDTSQGMAAQQAHYNKLVRDDTFTAEFIIALVTQGFFDERV
jgi:hypothetical protein